MYTGSIELKSNKYVLTLVMDKDVPFERILSDVGDKFKRSARFFGTGQMALEFSGRELTDPQQRQVIDAIRQNCLLDIICIVEENPEKESRQYEAIVETLRNDMHRHEAGADTLVNGERRHDAGAVASGKPKKIKNIETDIEGGNEETAIILMESLDKTQKFSSDKSVVVLGDVGPRAEISSEGSIIVCGIAMGTLKAGVSGRRDVFVAAVVLKSAMLEICGHKSISVIRKKEIDDTYSPYPQIASIDEQGHLRIAQMTGGEWRGLFSKDGLCSDNTD